MHSVLIYNKFKLNNIPIKTTLMLFCFLVLVLKGIAAMLFYYGIKYAPMLEVYEFFSVSKMLRHLFMQAIPNTWPNLDIKSYVYDFSVVYAITSNLDVIANKPLIMSDNILPYGPFSLVLFYLLSLIKMETSLIIYRIVSTILFCIVIYLAIKRLEKNTFFRLIIFSVLVLICTPFAILVSSGNIEIFLFSLCLLGLLIKGDKPITSAVILGACTAIKYYPLIFIFDFIKDRNIKALIISVITAIALFFIPFFILRGGFLQNLKFTIDQIALSSQLCYHNAAQFCTAGGLSMGEFFYNTRFSLESQHVAYKATSIIILFSGIWAYIRIKSRPMALIPLITIICLIPQVSVFYKLSYLMIPVLLSDDSLAENWPLWFLIALSLSPIPFYFALNFSKMRADFSFLLLLIHAYMIRYALINTHNNYKTSVLGVGYLKMLVTQMAINFRSISKNFK